MNQGKFLEASMVGPLEILVTSTRRQIGQGFYKSGRYVGITSTILFLAIRFSLVIET